MIFDTDVLIGFFRGDPRAARFIDSELHRGISIISLIELIQGARSKTEIAAIRRSLRELDFDVIPVNEAISYLAAALMEKHARSDGLHLADALIAATAQERGDTLATANVRHFRALDKLDLRAFHFSRQPYVS